MKRLQRSRPYRLLRVAFAVAITLPRYLWLLFRGAFLALSPSRDAWDRAHEFAAGQLYKLAIELEGGFIKVAQIVGARADVLPEPFIRRLRLFHDAVPARPFETLRPVLERELGAPVASKLAWVAPQALAAASLAQVHRARLHDGSEVVLKIQYPEARRIVPFDMQSARWVVRLIARLQRRVDLRSIVDEVARMIGLELDFEREARSTARIAEAFAGSGEVRVPRVYPEYSGEHLLVLEYLEGIQVTHLAALRAADHDLARVARRIARLYATMIFEHGFFHGDPHPGNLLVLPDGRIGLLDFGLCKQLPEGFARRVARMILAGLGGDAPAALEAARELGFDIDGLHAQDFRALTRVLMGEKLDGAALARIASGARIEHIPSDLALLVRTLILLNGLSHVLAPGQRLIQQEFLARLGRDRACERRRVSA